MTTYGTIPTSSSSPNKVPNLEYISRTKDYINTTIATTHPWKHMFNFHSFKLPTTLASIISRIRTSINYFRMNYAIIMLFILFLSLLWHPISLIVFLACMAAWLYLYFLRDETLKLFNMMVDDRVVLIFLSFVSVFVLLMTHVSVNVLVALAVGVVVVLVHAGLRRIDDLCLDVSGDEAVGFLVGHGNSSSS